MKKNRLIKGTLKACKQAWEAVDELQRRKLASPDPKNFCYRENVEEEWEALINQPSKYLDQDS